MCLQLSMASEEQLATIRPKETVHQMRIRHTNDMKVSPARLPRDSWLRLHMCALTLKYV